MEYLQLSLSVAWHWNVWKVALSIFVSGNNPSEVSPLGLKGLTIVNLNLEQLVVLLWDGDSNFTSLVVKVLRISWSLVCGVASSDTSEEGTHVGEDSWDTSDTYMLGVGGNEQVLLAWELVPVDLCPIHLHKLVIGGYCYQFGDFLESIKVE